MTARPARGTWLWLGLALALLAAHALSFRFVVDDAFISFRYARNLVDGHGLVFNPGERVEGYSNLLWVLLSAAGMKLGVAPLLWARLLGTAALGALLGLLPGILALLAPRDARRAAHAGPVAQVLAAATGAVACWMWAGLETPLFTLLVVLAWRCALRRQPAGAGVVGLLLVLTRPEGPALGLIFLAWSLLPEAGRPGRVLPRWRPLLGPALFLLGTAAFFLWRHAYYGWWLPNTYYAKTGDAAGQLRTGLPYTLGFLRWYGLPLCAASLLAVLRGGADLLRTRPMLLTLGVLLFWLGYVTIIGGDMLGMFRFYVPVLPLLTTWTTALLAGAGWLERPRPAALIALVLIAALFPPTRWGRERRLAAIHLREANLGGWMLAGDAMAAQLPAGASVALGPAGYIPWRTGMRSTDFYGLVDPRIAHRRIEFSHGYAGHEKHDGKLVLERRPDYILIGNVDITDRPRTGLIPPLDREIDIVTDPAFQQGYEQIAIPTAGGKWLNLFRRKGMSGS